MCADKLGRICLDILKGASLAFDPILEYLGEHYAAIFQPTSHFLPILPPYTAIVQEPMSFERSRLTNPRRQVVTRAPDPHRPALRPGAPQRAQPRRPARDGRREALQGERGRRAARQPRVDREVRQRLATACIAGCRPGLRPRGVRAGLHE